MNAIDRRQWLQWVAASAAGASLPKVASAQPRLQGNPFALGVASGSPTADSVVLWTRLIDSGLGKDPVPVRWEVAHDEGFGRIVQSGRASAQGDLAHSVHVEVAGLEPDRWYFYRFMVGDAASPVGRTRTFPAPGAVVKRLRLAYASCQRWEHGYFSAYRHMLAENLDVVLFLGDYIYEYPGAINGVRLPNVTPSMGFVVTLDDYRSRYALHKSEVDLQAMHAACPWLMTWDDHEVQNDYAGLQAGNSSVADVFSNPADFAKRRAAAYQAYYEHVPIRASALTRALTGLMHHEAGAELRLYQRVDFGNLARLYLLDARQYKDPQVCTKGDRLGSSQVNPAKCPAWSDPARTLLGRQQEAWLSRELEQAAREGKTWNVIGQQTLFGQRDNHAGAAQSFFNDGWDGYSAARTRLTNALQKSRAPNPVLLGGDVHENWVGHVLADYNRHSPPATGSIGVEFCGTSITSRSGGNDKTAGKLAKNPHFVFADAERKGYGVVEFTPGQLTTTLRVVDDVTRPDTRIETLARFHVDAGRPVIEKA